MRGREAAGNWASASTPRGRSEKPCPAWRPKAGGKEIPSAGFQQEVREMFSERCELERYLTAHYARADDFAKCCFLLAVEAVNRDDASLARAFFSLGAAPRHGGRECGLDRLEHTQRLGAIVPSHELEAWAAALSQAAQIGDPDLITGLDNLARRRVAH